MSSNDILKQIRDAIAGDHKDIDGKKNAILAEIRDAISAGGGGGEGGNGVCMITLTEDKNMQTSETTYTIDKNYSEIREAIDNDNRIYIKQYGSYGYIYFYPLTSAQLMPAPNVGGRFYFQHERTLSMGDDKVHLETTFITLAYSDGAEPDITKNVTTKTIVTE